MYINDTTQTQLIKNQDLIDILSILILLHLCRCKDSIDSYLIFLAPWIKFIGTEILDLPLRPERGILTYWCIHMLWLLWCKEERRKQLNKFFINEPFIWKHLFITWDKKYIENMRLLNVHRMENVLIRGLFL